jgi:hypothetical protein
MHAFLFSLFILFSSLTIAQTNDAHYEISELFHQRAHRFNCSFVKTEIRRIKELSESGLDGEVGQEISVLQDLALEAPSSELTKDLNTLASELEHTSNRRERIVSGLEALCRRSRGPVLFTSRALALGNSAVLQSLTFPLMSFVSFWNGVFNRKKSELGPRSDFIYRAFGPKRSLGSYSLSILATETLNYLLTPNPVLTALNVSIAIEMITNYRCFHRNLLDPGQVAFCEDYSKLQDFFYRAQAKSFQRGHDLQLLLDKKIMHKRANLLSEEFCAFSPRKQIRRARQVLQRHTYLAQDKRIVEAHILLPIHRNTCTKLLFYTEEDASTLAQQYTKLEGVEVVVMKKGTFPEDYYFKTEELQSMSFEDSLCYEAETAHFGQYLTGKMTRTGDLLKSSLAPSLLGAPEIARVIVPDQKLRQGKVKDLRNIIFSIGNSPGQEEEALRLKDEQKKLSQNIRRDYKKILKSGSHQSCRKILHRREVDLVAFEETLRRLGNINLAGELQRQLEFDAVENFFKKERRRLKLNWELIRTNSLQDIMTALKSHNVGNVVIISHGKNSGHLVDVMGQEFPRETFNQISPTIQSINFYSCYSQKLIDLYSLKDKLILTPSFHKVRHLSSVSENDFMDAENFAPISAFGYYLGQLDSYLGRSIKGSKLLQKEFGNNFSQLEQEPMCTLDVSDFQIRRGSYAITLNDELIATKNDQYTDSQYFFPCRFYREGINTLRVKNIINQGGSVIDNLKDFSLSLDGLILDRSHSSLRLNSMVVFKFTRDGLL